MSGFDSANKQNDSGRTFTQAMEQACLQSDLSALMAIEAELQLTQASSPETLTENHGAVGAATRAEAISNSKAAAAMTLEELCLGFMDDLASRTGAGASIKANQNDAAHKERAREERYRREEQAYLDEIRRAEQARLLTPSAILPAVDFEDDEPGKQNKRSGNGRLRRKK